MVPQKIILDTNIIISALIFEGKEREILKNIIKREADLYITRDILKEIERVLEYPKFHFTQTQKDTIKLILSETAILISTSTKLNLVKEDPSDNKFLEAALEADADYLITGDKHLLKVKTIGNTKIIKSSDFLSQ